MKKDQSMNLGLLRLGGIAGICAGLFILTFAIVAESKGIIFVLEVFTGGSIKSWLQNVITNPASARFIIVFPILGFSSMLVVGIVLFQMISESSWQKTLSLAGYLIGVPVVVSALVAHLSLMNQLVLLSAQSSEMSSQIELYTTFAIHRWMVINAFIGPFFIIIIGHTLIGWTAHKSGILPKWMAYWALLNGSLLLVSFLYLIFPFFEIAGFGAPSSMLWLIALGIILLRRTKAK